MTCPETPDEVSGGLIFFNMLFDWQNIQSVCFGCFHVCFPSSTITCTWISSPLILVTSPGYLTLSYCTRTQSPVMLLYTQSGIQICYLIWWHSGWQWHVIIFHSDSRWFIHFHGGVPHFNYRPSANSNMTIWNSWSLTNNVPWIQFYDSGLNFCLINVNNFNIRYELESCSTIDPLPLFLTCSITLAFAAPPMSSITHLPCKFAKYFQETGRLKCCESRHRSFPTMNWFLNSLCGT